MSRNNYQPSAISRQPNRKMIKILNIVFILITIGVSFSFCSWAQEQFVYNSGGRRDPFIALVTPDGRLLKLETEDEKTIGLSLEGIIYQKDGLSYAVVNGEVVKVNDKIGKYEVFRIEEKKVIFTKDGQYTEIVLEKEEQ